MQRTMVDVMDWWVIRLEKILVEDRRFNIFLFDKEVRWTDLMHAVPVKKAAVGGKKMLGNCMEKKWLLKGTKGNK